MVKYLPSPVFLSILITNCDFGQNDCTSRRAPKKDAPAPAPAPTVATAATSPADISSADGVTVGDVVARARDIVGLSVGLIVGLAVGDTVGDTVGDNVGDTVGDIVGLSVGLTVGDTVGLQVPGEQWHKLAPRKYSD